VLCVVAENVDWIFWHSPATKSWQVCDEIDDSDPPHCD